MPIDSQGKIKVRGGFTVDDACAFLEILCSASDPIGVAVGVESSPYDLAAQYGVDTKAGKVRIWFYGRKEGSRKITKIKGTLYTMIVYRLAGR